MPIDVTKTGFALGPTRVHWDSSEAMLYALAVGCGQRDLAFTTENSIGVAQQVLPSFGIIIGDKAPLLFKMIGSYDPTAIFHGAQRITAHQPIPPSGSADIHSRILGIYDKGGAALIEIETSGALPDGDRLFTNVMSIMIEGEGGWGGERGPAPAAWALPDRPPDHVVRDWTRPDQALLFRLTGDRHPLHSDPAFAAAAGFARPILHGLCTYGFAGRALLGVLCGGEPARFRDMAGRLSAPVEPGEELETRIWRQDDETALFRTVASGGRTVIDRGVFGLRADPGMSV